MTPPCVDWTLYRRTDTDLMSIFSPLIVSSVVWGCSLSAAHTEGKSPCERTEPQERGGEEGGVDGAGGTERIRVENMLMEARVSLF